MHQRCGITKVLQSMGSIHAGKIDRLDIHTSLHRRSRRRYRERYLTSLRWHNPGQVIRVRSQPFLLQEGHPESTKAIIGGQREKINLQSSEDSNNGEQSLADTPLRGSRPAFFTHALSGVAQRYLDMDGNRGFTEIGRAHV